MPFTLLRLPQVNCISAQGCCVFDRSIERVRRQNRISSPAPESDQFTRIAAHPAESQSFPQRFALGRPGILDQGHIIGSRPDFFDQPAQTVRPCIEQGQQLVNVLNADSIEVG